MLDGTLALADGTDPYQIEAAYWVDEQNSTPRLTLVGDTGLETMLLRRSFPFRTVLARIGDADCKLDKPAV